MYSSVNCTTSRTRVVFVGGGFGNIAAMQKLTKKGSPGLDITLIDPKPDFYCALVSQRALVSEEVAKSALIPYHDFWRPGAVDHVLDKVVSVNTEAKTLRCGKNSREIPYDVLVVGTGRSYPAPFRLDMSDTSAGLLTSIRNERLKIESSDTVVVVGGGATGVETAAEIKSHWPDKSVRLEHSGNALLHAQPEMNDADRENILSTLQGLGVEVSLGKRFVPGESDECVLWTNGATPNTSWCPEDWLDAKGFLKTDQHLLVSGTSDVLALGDVVAGASPTVKTAMFQHAGVVASNVLSISEGHVPSTSVRGMFFLFRNAFAVALGPNHAVSSGILGRVLANRKQSEGAVSKAVYDMLKNN